MIQEIESGKILETAMGLVGSAQKSVRMTMQAEEELQQPLPEEYFLLLNRKLNEGIEVERVGFGNEQEFSKLTGRVLFEHPRYSFHRVSSSDYRRMLLIDGSKLMFAKSDSTGRHVYFTEDKDIIADFKEYLTSHIG